ncbi:hypothetical protein HHX47_DHR8000390 [Lentinula edodes]|nr:hypothetical protein HHX47_DHR8000390 [Lentinula edodes]
MSNTKKLRIAIIGGGIGGLTCAVALRDCPNIELTLYEQAAQITEIGAGITVWPRTWMFLKSMGLEEDLLTILPEGYSDEPSGALCFHRQEIQKTLLKHVPEHCRIHLSHRLSRCEESEDCVKMYFENGLEETCDILIGADGIKSVTRELFQNNGIFYTGSQVFRGLIPKDDFAKSYPTHKALDGPIQHIVVYPISGGRIINVVAFFSNPVDEGKLVDGPTIRSATTEEALHEFSGWEVEVGQLLGDGYVLGRLFSTAGPEKWERILQAYNHVRHPFGNKIQRNAREQGFYYELNAPGFENITTMGQELSPEQISLLRTSITQNWSWWEEDADEDLARAVEFLNAGSGTYSRLPNDAANSETRQLLNGEPVVHSSTHGGQITVHPNGHSYSYTYGPKGLAGLALNRYALLCAVFASIGGLSFGYDQGVIANVLVMKDFMTRWPISPLEEGFMIIFCIGSTLQCGARSLLHLFLGRAIGGVGVGALSTLSPLYMAEISPPEVRGSLMALEQFAIVLGVVLGFWLGYFTRDIPGSASWRIPLGVQIIPALILILGCTFLPASPRLLVLQGRYDEAIASLAQLRLRSLAEAQEDPLIQIEFLEMRVEAAMIHRRFGTAENSKSALSAEWIAWKRLFGKNYRDRTMVGILIAFFQQWSGINALLYYGPILVRNIGLSGGNVTLLVSGGIGIVQFLAVLPVIAYIDKWGRRPLLRGGSIAMTCSHFSISILVKFFSKMSTSRYALSRSFTQIILFASDWTAHSTAAWIGVGFVYTFTAAYGMSFGPVAWVLPSEVFPLSMRSKGVALSTASVWVNNFLIGLITPVTLEWSAAGTFMMFAVASFLAYIWVTYNVPETANVSLEEIDEMFKSSAGREESILKAQIEEDLGLRALMVRLARDEVRD